MRIEQLLYVVEIAKNKSFSLAAKSLHISQPSLSQAITKLENELGIKLFNRHRSGVSLTKKGGDIVKKAQMVLRTIDEIKNEANIHNSQFTGKLSIGVIPSVCMSLFPNTLHLFKKKFPGVILDILEGGSNQIIEGVKKGNLDIGFIGIPINSWDDQDPVIFNKLINGEIIACVGKHSTLSFSSSITPSEIIKHPIVLFNSHYQTNNIITNLLRNYGEIKTLFSSDNTESAKHVIAKGLAIGFYTDLSLKVDPFIKAGKIIPLPIKNVNTDVTFGWIYSKKHSFSQISREFIKVLKSELDSL